MCPPLPPRNILQIGARSHSFCDFYSTPKGRSSTGKWSTSRGRFVAGSSNGPILPQWFGGSWKARRRTTKRVRRSAAPESRAFHPFKEGMLAQGPSVAGLDQENSWPKVIDNLGEPRSEER